MGKPCGCAGACGCDIRGRNGVRVTGTGSPPDTMWIELDTGSPTACQTIMDCVGSNLGNGLSFNPVTRIITARISGGENQLTFGPDGGLLVTGAGGGGDGGQTVGNLPGGTNGIIGSSWGAGSSLWPEGPLYSIEAARTLIGTTVRMVHLPVRCTRDLYAICVAQDEMGFYERASGGGNSFDPRTYDHREHPMVEYQPGGSPPAEDSSQVKTTSTVGYFGYNAPVSTGTPTLGEAFDLLARKAVMVIEQRDEVNPSNTLVRIKEMAPQWNAAQSVIVVGEPVTVTSATGPTIIEEISTWMAGSGIATGVVFRTFAQMSAYNAAALTALGLTWVFVDAQLADPSTPGYLAGRIESYRDAGLNVMLCNVQRQYQWARSAELALRGCLCTDPVYAPAAASGWRYRANTWSKGFGTPNPGEHSPWSDVVPAGQQSHYRGYVINGQPDIVTVPADVINPNAAEPYQSAYWNLAGVISPLESAASYAIEMWAEWSALSTGDLGRWIGMFFDRPTDRPLKDWTEANTFTVGYSFTLGQDGLFVLYEYDGTPGAPPPARQLIVTPSGYGAVSTNQLYGLRAEVTQTAIRLYRSSTAYPTFTKVLVATHNNPHRYVAGNNAGYVFWGRHFFQAAGAGAGAKQIKVAGVRPFFSGF